MAIKAISQFDAATPTSNDKILFEQNGDGKSTTLADLPISIKTQTALNTKVNTADVLTLEEIMEATDLTGKVADAGSVKSLDQNKLKFYAASSETDYRMSNSIGFYIDNNNGNPIGHIIFNITWIKLQFMVKAGALSVRFKYGDSGASAWKQLIP